ncbi:riboflavin biosynthesis protein RibF [Chloroflexi bacterium TSY]|nr:riboflavin biosynthesis protein RibF [Chloroflexi bacterium TSY]
MRIYQDVQSIEIAGPTFLTIGNFDGFHLGHQSLIQTLKKLANETPADVTPHVGLLTFDPHPLSVLRPQHPIQLLTTPQERLTFAAQSGANLGIIQPFTEETAGLRAVEFMSMLKKHLGLAALVVGPDFALGHGRSGNLTRLEELGKQLGYQLNVMEQIETAGESVRSSRIRQLLAESKVDVAGKLLGRPYYATGQVVEGDKRGRLIGVPTANLAIPKNKLLPPNGVYATRTEIIDPVISDSDEQTIQLSEKQPLTFPSVSNLGVRPTVDGQVFRFETHLLDFPPPGEPDNLYGKTVRVEFIQHLRNEQRFENLDALVAQIQLDIEQARQIFSGGIPNCV